MNQIKFVNFPVRGGGVIKIAVEELACMLNIPISEMHNVIENDTWDDHKPILKKGLNKILEDMNKSKKIH